MGTIKKKGSGDGASSATITIKSIMKSIGGAGSTLGAMGKISELKKLIKELQTMVLINENKSKIKKLKKKINKLLKGLQGSLKGTKLGCMLFGGDPVNLCTGNFVMAKEDMKVKGLLPIKFTRVFNAMDKEDGVLGLGWSHNYQIFLDIEEDEILVHREDGSEELYVEGKHGEFVCTYGGYHKLNRTEQGYTLKYPNRSTFYFNQQGELNEIHNLNGNKLVFTHSKGKLAKVENESGGFFTYEYDESGHLVEIMDNIGRTVRFSYEENRLIEVQGVDQTTVHYDYDEDGQLTTIINQNEVTALVNAYDSQERIVSQTYADGGKQTYSYDDETNTVLFTEQNGNQIEYIHDEKFRHIQTIYEDSAESYTYNSNNRKTSYTDRMGNVTRYTYDDRGNVTSIIDAMQNKSCMTYNALNLPVSIKGPSGEETTFDYDLKGNMIETVDALGASTKLAYTSFGKPEKITLADGSQTKVRYDERGNVAAIIDEAGNQTQYEYDKLNRVVKTIDGRGEIMRYGYDSKDRLVTVTNQEGNRRHYQYNKVNKLIKVTDFDESTLTWEYDNCNRNTAFTDKGGNTTRYQYDLMGNVVEMQEPNGAVTTYQYNKLNRMESMVTPLGETITYEYDKNGNRTKTIHEDGSVWEFTYNALNQMEEIIFPNGTKERRKYDASGRVTQVEARNGGILSFSYDKLGHLVLEQDALGRKNAYQYDVLGNITVKKDAANRETIFEYYQGGLLKSIQYADGSKEEFEYDENKNMTKRVNSSGTQVLYTYDALNRVTRMVTNHGQVKTFTYDAVGALTSVTDAAGNTTHYTYSKAGNLVKVVDPAGHQVVYQYDSKNRLIGVEASEDISLYKEMDQLKRMNETNRKIRVTKCKRNAAGQITSIVDPLGNEEQFEYDKFGRMIKKSDKDGYETLYDYTTEGLLSQVSYEDGKSVMLSYDPLGKLNEIKDWLGTTTIQNDIAGRAEEITNYRGETISYEWGDMDERTRMVYPDGKEVLYAYDQNLKLESMTCGEQVYQYTYDEEGRLAKKSYPNGTSTSYTYHPRGKILSLVHEDQQGILASYQFGYDAVGNKTTIDTFRRDMPEESGITRFAYDAGNRVTDVWKNELLAHHYEYDAFGNRIYLEGNGDKVKYQYNELDQLVRETGIQNRNPIDIQYGYDKRGNQIYASDRVRGKKEYQFDQRGYLEQARMEHGNTISYLYDGMGNRIAKRDHDVETLFTLDYTKDRANLLSQRSEERVLSFLWDEELEQVSGMETPEQSLYYLTDVLGSPLYLTDGTGALDSSYHYDVFGCQMAGKKGTAQPIGFTGYEKEENLNLYFAKARYYNGSDGRFISQDIQKGLMDVPKTMNPYVYCQNLPMILVDPNGEWTEEQTKDGIVAHAVIEKEYIGWCAKNGKQGYAEYYIKSGVNNPNGELYQGTGTGRADMIMVNNNSVEVYEIKPYLGMQRGMEQIEAYKNGISSQPQYQGFQVENGTTYNPKGQVYDYPGDPTKKIVVYTYYETAPGVIVYSIRKTKPEKKPVPVPVSVGVKNEIEQKNILKQPVPVGNVGVWKGIGLTALATLAIIGGVLLFADDVTGIGAADDPIAAGLMTYGTGTFAYLFSACPG